MKNESSARAGQGNGHARRAATSEQILKTQHRLLRSVWLREGVLAELQSRGLTAEAFDSADDQRIYDALCSYWVECGSMPTEPTLQLRLGAYAQTLAPVADQSLGLVSGSGAVQLYDELRAQLAWRAGSDARKRAKVAIDNGDPAAAKAEIARWEAQTDAAFNGGAAQQAGPKYVSLADSMRALVQPVGARLASCIATLDKATRGGVPVGRVVTLVGAPGAGKTGLAVYLGDLWEQDGAAVCILAADEEPRGILTRIGQRMGYSRDAIEGHDDNVRHALAEKCIGRGIIVIDPDADESMRTIEDAHAALVHFACERPRVLIIDSIQTCLCAAAMSCDTIRERIAAKMRVIKSIAKTGTLVIVISEMARAGYRSGDKTTDISALAAGKESSDIEYGSALLLGLRSVRDATGQTDVEVAKNRLGAEKPTFRLRLDFETAGWSEIATPGDSVQVDDSRSARESDRDLKAEQIVQQVIADHPGVLASQNDVLALAKGAQRAAMNRALKRLITTGAVHTVNGVYALAKSGGADA